MGDTVCPKDRMQSFQEKFTKHGKTGQNDNFLYSMSKFFLVRMGLTLGHYNLIYSVSSGIYQKPQKFWWTHCIMI